MAHVMIRVECDGGSITVVEEQSAIAIYGGGQAALLAQEAFVRICRALGVPEHAEAPAAPLPKREPFAGDISAETPADNPLTR